MVFADPGDRELADLIGEAGAKLAAATGLPATTAYGPRCLHSTGQLHKGGPDSGLFVQVVPDDDHALTIPGKPYDFETLKQAQAAGDFRVLERRGRRALRLRYGGEARAALRALLRAIPGPVRRR